MNLKKIRQSKGLSQSQLVKLSGVNIRVIQCYEQGKRNINNGELRNLVRLAVALDCTVSDLLTETELIELCKKTKL